MEPGCPRCGTLLDYHGACPTCAFVAQPTPGVQWPQRPLVYNPYHRTPGRPDFALSMAALLVNILFLAGLGSLIARQWLAGTLQLLLYAGGTMGLVAAAVLGGPEQLVFLISLAAAAGWVWGLVTGIKLVRDADR